MAPICQRPFSQWKRDNLPDFLAALDAPAPDPVHPLGLYLHIPFCRKRCHFCYFKVYTDKDATAIKAYLETLAPLTLLEPGESSVQLETWEIYRAEDVPSTIEALGELIRSLRLD